MRIGIITYWESNDNYGQQLQCWALQQFLKQLGHDPFLIRFKRFNGDIHQNQTSRPQSLITKLTPWIKHFFKYLFVYPILHERKLQKKNAEEVRLNNYIDKRNKERLFSEFRTHNLALSEFEYNNIDELRKNPPQADVYITGSDQVWNFNLQPEELEAYFLQWGDKRIKRIAYAPSIGHNTWPKGLQEKLKTYLSSFNAISVRESTAVNICKQVGYEAIHVFDPTLLLSSEDYLFEETSQKGNPFIYIYSLNYQSANDIPWQEIREYAKVNNLKIKVTPGSGYVPGKEIFEDVEYEYSTIPQWISNIKNANLVITASFHGVVFALLNHTKIVFTPLKGPWTQSNTRGAELLERVHLKPFIWGNRNNFKTVANQAIYWPIIDNCINKWRLKSAKFLEDCIK